MTRQKVLGACSISLVLTAVGSAQTPAGPEFRVNTYTTGTQYRARSAMAPNGDFVIVWVSDQDNQSIIGQRFAASGARRGNEFRVNTETTGTRMEPAIAVGSKGDFVVVWVRVEGFSNRGIRGRRYDASGSPIGGEFLVNTLPVTVGVRPRVARGSDDRFVVSWMGTDGDGAGIVARRFDASGHSIGSELVVNTYTTAPQQWPDLAFDANGDLVVVWGDIVGGESDGSGAALFGQRYDASGTRLGGEFRLNTYTLGDQLFPSISASPAGGFVVAWSTFVPGGPDVFARRFDAAGNAVGDDFVVNTGTPGSGGYGVTVAHDARGDFVVTWPAGQSGVFAQRFGASGARRGAEFRVNTYTLGDQGSWPSVASDSVGNFVVTWQRLAEGRSFDIFAQRFGGLGAVALTVDSTGNQILEPGETVDVRPSWRNFSGVALTVNAALSNMTGPAGARFRINDPHGGYGTVVDGSTVQCADCYRVTLSNPNLRPAVHWDASVVESILPDTQGQRKPWRLHVGASFTDVATTSPFYPFIEKLLHNGVTGGCGGTSYCPSAATTRDQMSVFVLAAKEGAGYTPPACGAPLFDDVPASSPFCSYIEELARRGVVSGCGGGNYCPTSAVTRDQMAIFVLRTLDTTLDPPACGTPMFNDVPAGSPFCKWIEELARRGVVGGCGNGNYCPGAAVTREQMGVFISSTFGLTLYGP